MCLGKEGMFPYKPLSMRWAPCAGSGSTHLSINQAKQLHAMGV